MRRRHPAQDRRVAAHQQCAAAKILDPQAQLRQVVPLQWLQLGVGLLLVLRRGGENHLPHSGDPFLAQKHMLSTAEPNALRPALACVPRLVWRIGVGPYAKPTRAVGVTHKPLERLPDLLLARTLISFARSLELRLLEL